MASRAAPVSRKTGPSQFARGFLAGAVETADPTGTTQRVLLTRRRHRPKVRFTISISVCSTAAGAGSKGAEAVRVR
ncbi:MAG TPA: hypothetical protein VMW80_06405 [Candidatus Dormibacteraeota bacterium]|nr:hypothetical protein [Candidatus Dormibacteraeota bacterium]